MSTSFRIAEEKDIDSLIEVSRYTINKCYRSWLEDRVVDKYLTTDSLDKYLIKSLPNTWLVEVNSSIVGLAICVENMIDYILVHTDHQRNGVGLELLDFCEHTLFEGYTTIAIENFALNSRPISYFEANGWKYVNKYLDPKFDLVKYIYTKKIIDSNSHLKNKSVNY